MCQINIGKQKTCFPYDYIGRFECFSCHHSTGQIENSFDTQLVENETLDTETNFGIDYVKENEDNLPLRINANKIFKILKDELNVAPPNHEKFILDEIKPLLREFVVEYNTKKNHISEHSRTPLARSHM